MTSNNTIEAARVELLLSELRLPAIKLMWATLAARADKEGWPAARFLAALAEHEVADRGRRRIERHLASARLPAGKTFDTFDFNAVPIRITAEAYEGARKANENASAALTAAVVGENTVKQALDSIRRQLATVRNDPRAARSSIDIADQELAAQLSQFTATLDQHRIRQGEVSQKIVELQNQINQTAREVTRCE